jgi:hypothetical protein
MTIEAKYFNLATNIKAKPLGIEERRIEGKDILRQIKNCRHLIESPEYFYQQPTSKQEDMFKEDYEALLGMLSEEKNVRVPKTIETYFGKVAIIEDELYLRDFCKIKYQFTDQQYEDYKDSFVNYKSLRRQHRKAIERLDSLSPKEVEALKAKTANTPLQVIDFPTGRLFQPR